jgi:hypothetical protein
VSDPITPARRDELLRCINGSPCGVWVGNPYRPSDSGKLVSSPWTIMPPDEFRSLVTAHERLDRALVILRDSVAADQAAEAATRAVMESPQSTQEDNDAMVAAIRHRVGVRRKVEALLKEFTR